MAAFREWYSDFVSSIFKKKYALTESETWEQAVDRVVEFVNPPMFKKEIKRLMLSKTFIPGGRILYAAGRDGTKATLLNCYYLDIPDDSIEGIFQWLSEMARTFSYGGGVGTDISILRPKGSPVSNSAGVSTGAVSFMNLASFTTDVIGQQGRRGALLLSMRVDHPDIMDFIRIKSELYENWTKAIYNALSSQIKDEDTLKIIEQALIEAQINRANISVQITDEFMEAVKEGRKFTLRYEFKDGKYPPVEKEVDARQLFRLIAEKAWRFGEPGVLFVDNAKKASNTEYFAPVRGTNPCGEIWLENYGCCNLGSLNLAHFYNEETASFDYDKFEKAVAAAVAFLDAVVDAAKDKHPFEKQSEAHQNSRRLGLGVMGLADLLFKLGLNFNDLADENSIAYKTVSSIAKSLAVSAYKTSIKLASLYGPFRAFDREKYLERPFAAKMYELMPSEYKKMFDNTGIRNAAMLAIAPTGTISLLAGVASSIEPMFSLYMKRWSESLNKEVFIIYESVLSMLEERFGSVSVSDVLEKIELLKKERPYLVTTEEVSIDARLENTKIWQSWIDNSISQTINLPFEATIEDVEKIYMKAWEYGAKGITIYRAGSRNVEVVKKVKKDKKEEEDRLNGFMNVQIPRRPVVLNSVTYKIKYEDVNYYITITYDSDTRRPLEVLVTPNNMDEATWWTALGRVTSAVLRRLAVVGEDYDFLIEGLNQVKSIGGKGVVYYNEYIPSKPAIIAKALEWFKYNKDVEKELHQQLSVSKIILPKRSMTIGNNEEVSICPKCGKAVVSTTKYEFTCDTPCPYCGYAGGKCI